MTTSRVSRTRLPVGLASYSFPVSCGYARRDGAVPLANPFRAHDLIALAEQYDLNGIEIPLDAMLPDTTPATLDPLKAALDARQMTLVVDGPIVDVEYLTGMLPLAARAGAKVMRVVVSSILEGARHTISQATGAMAGWGALATGKTTTASSWADYLAEIHRRVVAIVPVLKAHDIMLALENHQDCTSDELLAFCDIDPDHIGVTFDVVNPLAVAEEPFEFARKLGAHIRDVHIKDYTIRATPSGYRLIRAAIGQGVIDWPAMIALVKQLAPHAYFNIELAAIMGRHVRLFEAEWWSSYPARDIRTVQPVLKYLAERALPDSVPWQTPWERGESAEAAHQYEMGQLGQSVSYLRSILQ